jgi:hypothetical protein
VGVCEGRALPTVWHTQIVAVCPLTSPLTHTHKPLDKVTWRGVEGCTIIEGVTQMLSKQNGGQPGAKEVLQRSRTLMRLPHQRVSDRSVESAALPALLLLPPPLLLLLLRALRQRSLQYLEERQRWRTGTGVSRFELTDQLANTMAHICWPDQWRADSYSL